MIAGDSPCVRSKVELACFLLEHDLWMVLLSIVSQLVAYSQICVRSSQCRSLFSFLFGPVYSRLNRRKGCNGEGCT